LGIKDWLPKEAFSEAALKSALSAPIEGWSKRWLARGSALVTAAHRAELSPTAAQSRLVSGKAAKAELAGRGKRVLLEAVLDLDLAGLSPSEADHAVLDQLAVRIVEDLVAVLDAKLRSEDPDGTRMRFAVSINGVETLAVTLPKDALVSALKGAFGPARPNRTKAQSRMRALASMPVAMEGVLGRADLALSDVEGLSVGDVVVLDRQVQEPVELRLSGGQRVASGKLGRTEGRLSIHL
jgi:flagellar motor switch/type III secretory pathway protein FliN